MEVKSIKYLKRKNLGNYEHEEITLEGIIEVGETKEEAILAIMTLAHEALNGQLGKSEVKFKAGEIIKPSEEKVPSGIDSFILQKAVLKANTLENGQDIPPVIPTEKPKAAPRTKKKPTEESTPVETPSANAGASTTNAGPIVGDGDNAGTSKKNVVVDKVPAKGIVVFDSSVKEHRSRLATFLGTAFPKWKPDLKFGAQETPAKSKYEEDLKSFSKALHGKQFEDAKGNMLPPFKEELQTFFGRN